MPATAQTMAGQRSSLSGQEQADNYARVALTLDDRTRIIECGEGLQWILQAKTGKDSRWRAKAYCRQRASLERLASAHADRIGSVFPERHPGYRS